MVYNQTISALVLSEGFTAYSYTQLGNLAMFVMTIGYRAISLLFFLVVQCILLLPIRESVDSLCRDGADMPRPPYIGKACTRPNIEDLSLFRYLTIVYESLCTQ